MKIDRLVSIIIDMLLSMGENCECLEPAFVREKKKTKIKKLAALYESSPAVS